MTTEARWSPETCGARRAGGALAVRGADAAPRCARGRYVVAKVWWNKMESYFGATSEEEARERFPGPVDNESIVLAGYPSELKPSLDTATETEIVPLVLWNKLIDWFGLVPKQVPFPRQVTTKATATPGNGDGGRQPRPGEEAGGASDAAAAASDERSPTPDAAAPQVAYFHVVASVRVPDPCPPSRH